MSVAASVVIPTYRRNELLRACLENLARQKFDRSVYEVIVADDAGDAATAALVTGLAESTGVDFRYVAVGPAHGPAAARNCGWRAARGGIIAFTDDDTQPEPTWLKHGVSAMTETGAAAASGRIFVPLPPRPRDYQRDCAGLMAAEFVTANCFCRREALEQIGGFDERFTAAWREDSDLQFTLLEHGFEIVHASEAVVVHPVRSAKWGASVRAQKKAQYNVLLYRKHPELYRTRIAPMPKSYYLIASALLGSLVGVVAGWMPLATGGVAAWGVLTARFCLKRLRGSSLVPSHIAEMAITSIFIPPLALFWRTYGLARFRTADRRTTERRLHAPVPRDRRAVRAAAPEAV